MSIEFVKVDGGVCAAKGFSANGLNCGINPNKAKNDLCLIYSDKPCNTAAVYTKNKVKGAPIIVTNGFGIFKDKEKISYIKRVAKTKGIIILTDSDNAGCMIRKRILQAVDKDDEVINVYIPDVFGK